MRHIRSRKGSASALIVLMVVLLTVFGALALTGAASDLRLANRHADWSVEYYRLDADGERFLAAVSEAVLASRAGDRDAEGLIGQIRSMQVAGLDSVTCDIGDSRITVHAVVGDPESSGIDISLNIPLQGGKVGAAGSTLITRWAQFQKPFEYGTDPGGIWDGA